jgi:hypothetical protein
MAELDRLYKQHSKCSIDVGGQFSEHMDVKSSFAICKPLLDRAAAYRASVGLKPMPQLSGPIARRDGTTPRPNYCD